MKEYEVCCGNCGDFFVLETDSPELGEIYGECPHCGMEDMHQMTDDQEQ